MSIKP
jgi:hypothetical protein